MSNNMETKGDKIFKLNYSDFVALALAEVNETYTIDINVAPKFMKKNGYEPDSECYEIPDYVEIKLL